MEGISITYQSLKLLIPDESVEQLIRTVLVRNQNSCYNEDNRYKLNNAACI